MLETVFLVPFVFHWQRQPADGCGCPKVYRAARTGMTEKRPIKNNTKHCAYHQAQCFFSDSGTPDRSDISWFIRLIFFLFFWMSKQRQYRNRIYVNSSSHKNCWKFFSISSAPLRGLAESLIPNRLYTFRRE